MIGRMHANEGMDATSVHEGFVCSGGGRQAPTCDEGDMCMALRVRGRKTIN